MLLRFIPTGTKIKFVKFRRIYFVLSLIMLIAAATSYATQGLNFGIDFRGGILIEMRDKSGPANLDSLRSKLNGLGLGEVALQEFGQPSDVLIRVQRQPGGEKAQLAAITKIKDTLGSGVDYRRTEFVGPKVGAELINAGIKAVVFALIAIMLYVWFRFEWQFGAAAVIALTHDVLLTIGLFSELGLEFNLATVAAVLTVAGYSINDTVVVFDRVRENLRKYKKMPLPELMNQSINDTLSRTLMTSITTLLALFALFFFGGPVIRDFSIALIWGVVVGTYSSICLAVPLLLQLNLKRTGTERAAAPESESGAPAE